MVEQFSPASERIKDAPVYQTSAQRGSVLISILAAVGMVGVLSYTAFNMLSGPVRSAAIVTANTKAQNDMETNSRLLIRASTFTSTTADPPAPVTCPAGMTAPTVSGSPSPTVGCLPTTLGLLTDDPWHQAYRYCALSLALPADAAKKFIVIISSGPDRVLQTTGCANAIAGLTTTGTAASDDVVVFKTYNQANAENFWKNSATPGNITTLNPSSNVTVGNNLEAASINNTPIGTANPNSGAFTTLTATSTTALTGSTMVNNLSVAGSGTSLTLNPASAGVLNNTAIGGSTPAAGAFTTLTGTSGTIGALTATNAALTSATIGTANLTNITKTGTGVVANLHAENADNLAGQPATYYLNASNMNAGTLDAARMPALTGDVTSTAGSTVTHVVGLQGYPVLGTAPAANTVLGWNGAAWTPMTLGGGSGITVTESDPTVNTLFKNPVACSEGLIPKVVSGAWTCAPDNNSITTGSNLPLPLNSDNATSPAGVVIDVNAHADQLLYYNNTDANIFLGTAAGKNIVSGAQNNVFIGYHAGTATNNAAADGNTFVGSVAGAANTSGNANAFFGASSGQSNTLGAANTFLGNGAGATNSTGASNVYTGYGSGALSTVGTGNSFAGAASGAANTTGSGNVFNGYQSGLANTTGGSNTFLGYQTAVTNTTGANNIVIGSGMDVPTAATSSYLNLGNTLYGTMGDTTSLTDGGASLQLDGDLTLKNLVATGTIMGNVSGTAGSVTLPINADNATSPLGLIIKLNNDTFLGTGPLAYTAGNTLLGYQTGKAITTGGSNTIFGFQSGSANTTGAYNSYFGRGAGANNTTGASSVVVGYQAAAGPAAGYVLGANSVIIGNNAGASTTSGSTGGKNIFLGDTSGNANTTGAENVFVGYQTGQTNTSGQLNAFVGAYAGQQTTSGGSNAFFGPYAGSRNGAGNYSVAVGAGAAYGSGSYNLGNYSTIIGYNAGYSSSTGLDNTFLGAFAGQLNTTGADNTLLGYNSGATNTTGARNIIVGSGINGPSATTSDYINIGNVLYGNMVQNGSNTGLSDNSASLAVDGDLTARNITATGTITGSITGNAGSVTLPINADNATSPLGQIITLNSENFLTTGPLAYTSGNTALGYQGAKAITTGTNNSFFGYQAGVSDTSGGTNSFYGQGAGQLNTTANYNTFIGTSAGNKTTTGGGNTFLGVNAGLYNGTGSNMVAIGLNAAQGPNAGYNGGQNSVIIGNDAGASTTSGSSGNNNVFLGSSSGNNNTSGNYNAFLGYSAGSTNTTGARNIIVGSVNGSVCPRHPITSTSAMCFTATWCRMVATRRYPTTRHPWQSMATLPHATSRPPGRLQVASRVQRVRRPVPTRRSQFNNNGPFGAQPGFHLEQRDQGADGGWFRTTGQQDIRRGVWHADGGGDHADDQPVRHGPVIRG